MIILFQISNVILNANRIIIITFKQKNKRYLILNGDKIKTSKQKKIQKSLMQN